MSDSVGVQGNAKNRKTCPVCNTWFAAERSTAKYCSANCRKTAKEDRDALWRRVDTIKTLLEEIERTDHPRKLDALKFLKRELMQQIMHATPAGPELVKAVHEWLD